jgi:hypothetical protein
MRVVPWAGFESGDRIGAERWPKERLYSCTYTEIHGSAAVVYFERTKRWQECKGYLIENIRYLYHNIISQHTLCCRDML